MSPISGRCSRPPSAAPESRALVSGLRGSYEVPEPLGSEKFLCPRTHLARQHILQDVVELLPRPGKRLGIAPSFPQIWALSPGLPTGWALPPDIGDCPRGLAHLQLRPQPAAESSLLFSAPSTPADTSSNLAVSSPPPPRPGRAPGPHPPPSRRGRRSPRAAAGETGAGRGSPLPACCWAAAIAGAGRPETGAAFVCSLQRS